MKTPVMLAGILLLFPFLSYGLDPPVKVWEKWYYTNYDYAHFRDIELAPSGNLLITGLIYDYTPPPILENWIAILLNQDGDILWEVPHEFAGASGYDCEVLEDGSFVIAGGATPDTNSTSSGLYIHKISADGTTEWAKVYDYLDTTETGYGITCLPDGGFAVCGRVHGTGSQAGQAWLLRTDAQGDTLWTRTWGTGYSSYGKSVIFNNDEICVFTQVMDDTLSPIQGPHLLFFDLSGNYIRGVGFGYLFYHLPASLCIASDGGYTFVSNLMSSIWHTDQYGETLWWHNIPTGPLDSHEGFSIRQTMDNGYIFAGWTGWWQWPHDEQNAPVLEVDTGNTQEGWLVRYSEEGEYLWGIEEERGVDYHFYSAVQLPQGGYMACGMWSGQGGYLVRYAPETGIASPDPVASLSLEVSPNPFSSQLSVSFSLPEAGNASVCIYDLSGRLISTVTDGLFPAGSNSVEWAVPEELSSGCYFVQYNSEFGSRTESVALIK